MTRTAQADVAQLARFNPAGHRNSQQARQAIKRLLKGSKSNQRQALWQFLATGARLGFEQPVWVYCQLLGRYGHLEGRERGWKVREVLRSQLVCAVGAVGPGGWL